MKKLISGMLVFLLVLSLAACGGGSGPAESAPPENGEKVPEQAQQPQPTEQPAQAGGGGVICDGYNAFFDAKDEFIDYIVDQSEDHEIVAVKHNLATMNEINVFDHLLPLLYMEQSINSMGKFDENFETTMMQTGWADDAKVEYSESAGYVEYVVKGTDKNGKALEARAKYDSDADSVRLESYVDGALELLFEYVKLPGGYAAQYHFVDVLSMDNFTPVEGLCTRRVIFSGSNGSCARFDNVEAQPESIFGSIPDEESFIEGATHWYTVTDGSFTGNLGGEAF